MPGQDIPLCCIYACGGGAREGTMQLPRSSLAHFPMNSHVRLGVLPCGNPHCSPQSALSLSFTFSQPHPPMVCPLSSVFLSRPACRVLLRILPGLVVLVDFFFNSFFVGVPCNLIFWHFWLLSSFWLCEEAKGFYLCLHLGWNSFFFFFF